MNAAFINLWAFKNQRADAPTILSGVCDFKAEFPNTARFGAFPLEREQNSAFL